MINSVPFNDLFRLPESLKNEVKTRVSEVIDSGSYILGPELEMFETELSRFLETTETVGVSSGTDALLLSLVAAGVSSGDAILTMSNAGGYTTIAARAIGADPIFVDVSADSLQMSIAELRTSLEASKAIGVQPKALVVTHLFGQLNPDIVGISEICKSHNLVLIEDCAQSIGASNGSKQAGSFGSLSTFSFFPTKNLGAHGDAGAVSGNDVAMLSRVRQLRQYGWGTKYSIDIPFGRNSRLDEIQAAILRVKLPYVSSWNESRRKIYTRYVEAAGKSVRFYSAPDTSFVGHLCPITAEGFSQEQLVRHFASRGISTSIHFPIPDHKQKIDLKYGNLVPLPETEKSCANLITIPLFPELTPQEIETVCNALEELD